MRICLLTRYFDFRNAGIGRTSTRILIGLVGGGHSVRKVSTNGTSLYSYFFYTLIGIHFKMPKGCDVYHAMTPMEGMHLPKNRSVVTFHDFIPYLHPRLQGAGLGGRGLKSFMGSKYFELACRLASRATRLACNSEQTKSELLKHFGVAEEKIRVIRWGINGDLVPIPKKSETLRIGYLGQLDRRKRVDLLIKAFKESKLDAELVIGGSGADGTELGKLAEDDNRIKFLGFVPDNVLTEFYNSLDVLILPTMIEGYGLPPVEAMACKKPTIVLSDAIMPEEVKSRCIVVDNLGDTFDNHNRLEGLLRRVDYEGNYQFAKEHDWNKCVSEYIKLYEEVAE